MNNHHQQIRDAVGVGDGYRPIMCCPKCGNETCEVTIENSGVAHTEYGPCYWIDGIGVCCEPGCGFNDYFSDSSQ